MLSLLFKIALIAIGLQVNADSDNADLRAEHRFLDEQNNGLLDNINPTADLPQIKTLNVACEKSQMRVFLEFDRPFHGMVFSKGHYSENRCMHLPPSSGRLNIDFEIGVNSCGLTARSSTGRNDGTGAGAYIENTVIIQYDPLVQEVWDQARKLRCTWYDFYEKSVAFKPFNVDAVQAVSANFLGDNLRCWMQIQAGKGPWANEVSGIVKIGQTMTMLLAIQDDDNKFDMFVKSCVAHDGKRPAITLVDDNGCVVRPKIMSPFRKVNNFGQSASVVSYAYFQAFKFPDSMEVFFQCVIQVCRDQCPEPQCAGAPNPFADSKVSTLPAPLPPPNNIPNIPFPPPNPNEKIHTLPYPPVVNPLPPIPAPVPVPLSHIYPSIGRVGVASDEIPLSTESTEEKINQPPAIAGPRSYDVIDEINFTREKRSDPSADVKTTGHLRVVAPGDVAFNLGIANETVVVTQSQIDRNAVCLPLPGFVAGLVLLLFVLCMMLLVATFMFLRLRTYKAKERASVFE